MITTTRFLCTAALSMALLLMLGTESFATFITATPLPEAAHGSVWFVPTVSVSVGPGCPCEVVPMDSVPTTPADVTFSTSIINFSSFGTPTNTGTNDHLDFTIGSFLNSLGAVPLANQTYSPFASVLTGNVPTPDSFLLGLCAASASCPSIYGTFIEITGDLLLTTGSHIKIAHDDGVTLSLNGTLVPGFTSPFAADNPEAFTYLGPPGLVSFDLTYAESVEPPAFLQLAVPEPGTLALFGASLLGLGWLVRRRRA